MGFAENEEREQKGGYGYKTKHKPRSARNTGTKTGREESILVVHTRHRLKETGKQTRNGLGETKTIIGKAPRLGIHTQEYQLAMKLECWPSSERKILGTQFYKVR